MHKRMSINLYNVNEREGMNLSLDVCEIDKEYFEAAKKRYENHIAQTTIFS